MKSQPVEKQLEIINELVRKRDRERATAAIQSYLRTQRNSPASVFFALEGFRRLGEVQRSLRLLSKERERLQRSKKSQAYEFWLARTLNSIGASPFVLPLLSRLHPQSSQEWQILGDLYLATFEYKEALDCFEKALAFEKEPRAQLIQRLAIADSHAGLKNFTEAIRWALDAYASTSDSYLQAICLSALAEYQALKGNYKNALRHISQAETLFPPSDDSPDQAIFQKWKGYVLCKTGHRDEGLRLLKSSIEMFRKLNLRDETWLLAQDLLSKVEPLSPEEQTRLLFWPGLPPGFDSTAVRPSPAVIGDPAKAQFIFYPDSDEYQHKGKWFLGINRELNLLCWTSATAAFGLGLYRAISLIWPDRPYEIPQHLKRLNQLTIRLKKTYRFSIRQKVNRLYLQPADLKKVAVVRGASKPSFLIAREKSGTREFRSKDVRDYYSIRSAGTLGKTVARWAGEGWIQKINGKYTLL